MGRYRVIEETKQNESVEYVFQHDFGSMAPQWLDISRHKTEDAAFIEFGKTVKSIRVLVETDA